MNHKISLSKRLNSSVRENSLSEAQVEALALQVLDGQSQETMDAMYTSPVFAEPVEGALVTGRVVNLRTDDILIAYGSKSEGILPFKESDEFTNSDLDVGDQIKAVIFHIEDDGRVFLSRELAPQIEQKITTWMSLQPGMRINGTILDLQKQGAVVGIDGVEAFLPRNHMGQGLQLGDVVEAEVVRCDSADDVILSRRNLLEAEKQLSKEKHVASLQVGDIIEGIVRNLADFGAFIDIGTGIVGLCHLSDITNEKVEHPKDALQVGQRLQVKILKIDRDKKRVTLGIKQVKEMTLDEFLNSHQINDKVIGKVISILKYGAFVEVQPGIHGLIHVSEMSWSEHVRHPGDILKVGDMVEVVILGTDAKNRLALGLKQTQPDPWFGVDEKYFPGCRVQGKIIHKTAHGFFLEIEKGVDGFLSFKEAKSLDLDAVKIGDQMAATIQRLDSSTRRITLTI